jgi:hypothetical protein
MRLEICLELESGVFLAKGTIPEQDPRHVLGGVRGPAGIVVRDALF